MDPLRPPASPPAEELAQDFDAETVTDVRHAVRRRAEKAGLAGDALEGFVIAVHELVANAVRHGGGRGSLRLRRDDDTLVCDVTDYGTGFPHGLPVAGGPPPANTPGGRGILMARHFTDSLLFSDGPDGVTATVTVCLPVADTRDR
ncbi:hypothetical protein BG844_31410 [Couchioplanes caeruleus subsp. caeruleus]|uniref:Histidine kinase/HSP90-like ATPase domain-containing protein n=2 Tax=Couchioplanes caeruleus TaxID=56438 RepID=A0A1K0GN01_9ACTN|nr:hypothetical protein BG844_31410 [Couchioplanes caeruleus subsp. caeruleus]